MLHRLKHENVGTNLSHKIISLLDVFMSPDRDIYFVTELMEADLQKLLASRKLEINYVQYFIYQILVS